MSKKAFDKEMGRWSAWHDPATPLRLGVSSCLLGEEVRFDGGHARSRFVSDVLGGWFELVPVCPEVEIGMGTPRPTIRLFHDGKHVRLIAPSTEEDFTDRMSSYAEKRVNELQKADLDGYILKKGSPSCGMERIRVYDEQGMHRRDGVGMYAAVLTERWPALPVEEDGRLNDADLRENFIERVFCHNRWRSMVRRRLTRRRLVAFHTAHKLLLLSHNEAGYRRLGKLVGSAGQTPDSELFAAYETQLHHVMRTRATIKKHVNVLHHAIGFMKKTLPSPEKRDILGAIEDYGAGLIPLIVPLTLLGFNIRRYEVDYLAGQIYFNPHPKELMLRNHV
jgi:uncharacterized protein YbgA (DUF1722 family)/uncharacterized protein YbbK (DUF523 family)